MSKNFTEIVNAATEAFRKAPENATFVFNSNTKLVDDTECENIVRQHTFTIDEPAELGGSDKGANPVEMLLSSLASCRAITYQFHAGRLGVPLDGISVSLSGKLDLRGFLAMEDTIRPGFLGIEGETTLTTDASEEQVKALNEAVERYCPVANNLTSTTPYSVVTNVVQN